ncbi:GTP cyclohydrolase I [Kitasatospora brasiliensis]|uniref:GTP cyclohydrolase I n=1 Tax=Kitasatospora brasiliensis TaxID=3058040 RepID=UPI002931617F|nr:GTP cyclohydrolase I FolE [Kitasatospora sp. K002]
MHSTLTDPSPTRSGIEPAVGRPPIDTTKVAGIVRDLLIALGQDPQRPGLVDTPDRVARYWAEVLDYDPGTTDTVFDHQAEGEGCVAVGGIRITSTCEHHLLPFTAEVCIAYAPAGRVLGLSKLVRIAHKHAHKLQLQERLGAEIAEEVARLTDSKAVAVWMVGEHLCMTARGVTAHGARTATEYLSQTLAGDLVTVERLRRVAAMAGGVR